VSDSKGGIQIIPNSKLNIDDVIQYKQQTGSVVGFSGTDSITNKELLELDCDILIPAALENQITKDNAQNIKAKIILELANGPVTPEADDTLFKRGVKVIPDVLANAGGVIVSYFEWYQNMHNEKWTEEEIYDKLKEKMVNAFNEVWQIAEDKNINYRDAAYLIALKRLEESYNKLMRQ
jgi:glutamate dehydrogenase (NAD(P)+)